MGVCPSHPIPWQVSESILEPGEENEAWRCCCPQSWGWGVFGGLLEKPLVSLGKGKKKRGKGWNTYWLARRQLSQGCSPAPAQHFGLGSFGPWLFPAACWEGQNKQQNNHLRMQTGNPQITPGLEKKLLGGKINVIRCKEGFGARSRGKHVPPQGEKGAWGGAEILRETTFSLRLLRL